MFLPNVKFASVNYFYPVFAGGCPPYLKFSHRFIPSYWTAGVGFFSVEFMNQVWKVLQSKMPTPLECFFTTFLVCLVLFLLWRFKITLHPFHQFYWWVFFLAMFSNWRVDPLGWWWWISGFWGWGGVYLGTHVGLLVKKQLNLPIRSFSSKFEFSPWPFIIAGNLITYMFIFLHATDLDEYFEWTYPAYMLKTTMCCYGVYYFMLHLDQGIKLVRPVLWYDWWQDIWHGHNDSDVALEVVGGKVSAAQQTARIGFGVTAAGGVLYTVQEWHKNKSKERRLTIQTDAQTKQVQINADSNLKINEQNLAHKRGLAVDKLEFKYRQEGIPYQRHGNQIYPTGPKPSGGWWSSFGGGGSASPPTQNGFPIESLWFILGVSLIVLLSRLARWLLTKIKR